MNMSKNIYEFGVYAIGIVGLITAAAAGGYVDRMLGGDGIGGGIIGTTTTMLSYQFIMPKF